MNKISGMAKEIERKFLVTDNSYRDMATSSTRIMQGYISRRREGTVRVRVRGERAYLTIKGITQGIERNEWEYEIDPADAMTMLRECCEGGVLEKVRYVVPYGGYEWEVDEFGGRLAPLVVAEVELPSADEEVAFPPFIGREVSGDPAYYNSNLKP